MRKIILFFQIILIMLPAALYAQNVRITGKVRDLTGVLPGVSVVEKGLPTNGVTTDVNGHFTLTLKGSSNTVMIRFVGYVSQELKVGDKKTLESTRVIFEKVSSST